jgi:hypothetical protein
MKSVKYAKVKFVATGNATMSMPLKFLPLLCQNRHLAVHSKRKRY